MRPEERLGSDRGIPEILEGGLVTVVRGSGSKMAAVGQ